MWQKEDTHDTYQEVYDHPDMYLGDRVIWGCVIVGFLGADAADNTMTDVGCTYFIDQYNTPEVILRVPASIDMSHMLTGDGLRVYGTVATPTDGKNGFNAPESWTTLTVGHLVDTGKVPQN
jgi:hypothetical protein